MKLQTIPIFVPLLLSAILLVACEPSEKQRAAAAEEKRIECLDKICTGDIVPKHDYTKDAIIKLNGQWFIGPEEYFSSGSSHFGFEWWDHQPISGRKTRSPAMQAMAVDGKSEDFSISIFFRSNHIPPEPRGYHLIELAQKNDWIASRNTVRPGLDAITMKHVIGPHEQYIDHVTYYVATNLVGLDGLPPVAACNHEHPKNGGGSGFIWQPDIWAGVQINQKHCADWPEIFQETTRILAFLKKAPT